jgi:hypothetical protein
LSSFDEIGKEWRFPLPFGKSQSPSHSRSAAVQGHPSHVPSAGASSKGSEIHGHWEKDESGRRKWVTTASSQMTMHEEYQVLWCIFGRLRQMLLPQSVMISKRGPDLGILMAAVVMSSSDVL